MTAREVALLTAYAGVVAAVVYARYPAALDAFSPAPFARGERRPEQFILPSMVTGPAGRGSEATSQYRGDVRRTGVSRTSVPVSLARAWCRSPLNVGLHGASKASPAVDASGVYVGTDAGFIRAYDHAGRARWSVYLADAARGVHATAVLDADTLYVGAYNGVFYALEKTTGRPRWTKKLGHAIGASAVLHHGFLYVSVETDHPDGYLVKLDARDGHLEWASGWLGDQSHSSPTLAPDRGVVMAGANSGRLWAFAMSTGRTVWSRTLTDAMKGTALVVGDAVIFTGWDKRALALDVATGAQRWGVRLGATSQVSPTWLPRAGLVVTGDHAGVLRALDPRDGRVAWTHDAGVGRYQASGLVTRGAGGRETFWALAGPRTLGAFDARSGRVRGTAALDANFSGEPVAFGGALYLALDGADGGLCKFASTP